jgi:hypothetical protein
MDVDEPWIALRPPGAGWRRVWALLDLGRCLSTPAGGGPFPLRTDWAAVVATAEYFRLTPALWVVVGDRVEMEEAMVRRLRSQYAANVVMTARLSRQLRDCLDAINRRGIRPVVLKGAVELLEEADSPPARMMTDLDLLVADEEWDGALGALERAGYAVQPGVGASGGHEWTARHPHQAAPVDLHRALGAELVARALPTSDVLSRAVDRTAGDLRYRTLEPADQLAHAVLHSQCGDKAHRTGAVALRQLYNFSCLYHSMEDPRAWPTAVQRMTRSGLGRVVGGHAALERRIFNLEVAGPDPDAAARLHLARCLVTYAIPGLSDVITNLWLAFETPTMAARYPGTSPPLARLRHSLRLLPGGMRSLRAARLTRNR